MQEYKSWIKDTIKNNINYYLIKNKNLIKIKFFLRIQTILSKSNYDLVSFKIWSTCISKIYDHVGNFWIQ